MDQPIQLDPLGLKAKEHWRKHRPKMFRQLAQSGQLMKALYAAQELTHQALEEIMEQQRKLNPPPQTENPLELAAYERNMYQSHGNR